MHIAAALKRWSGRPTSGRSTRIITWRRKLYSALRIDKHTFTHQSKPAEILFRTLMAEIFIGESHNFMRVGQSHDIFCKEDYEHCTPQIRHAWKIREILSPKTRQSMRITGHGICSL